MAGYSSSFLRSEAELHEEICQRGIEGAPYECCGLVIVHSEVWELRQAVNDSDDPTRRYNFQTAEVVEGLTVDNEVIVWHTHPGGMVGPSELDLEMRKGIDLKYLVVTVPSGEAVYF